MRVARKGSGAAVGGASLLDGYRAGRFTPRDVIEDVIAALKSTDAVLQGMVATDMFVSGAR